MSKPFNSNYPITGAFGATGGAYGNTVHQGVDFGLPANTQVLAANGGRVSRVGNQSLAGNFIEIDVNGRKELYMHLNKISVSIGQNVSTGQVIGLSGKTGNATGYHLHYEVRMNGVAVDPTPYWQGSPQQSTPVVNGGGGRFKAIRVANVRPAPNTQNTPFGNRQLKPDDVFQYVRIVEGERVKQNGIDSNLWALSTKNGYVWVGNLVKI